MEEDKRMKEVTRKSIAGCLAFLLGFVLASIVFVPMMYCCGTGVQEVRTDTVVRLDTVRHDSLVAVKEEVVRYVRVPITAEPRFTEQGKDGAAETLRAELEGDSLMIPITQKVYTDDSTYTAWVSGYEAALDSIETYRRKEIVTKSIVVGSRKRWSIGLQGGFYATPKGVQPGIGIGISWTLWPP